MWIFFFKNNIIIKCQNVDKGREGGESDNVDKVFVCFRPFEGSFGLFKSIFGSI